MRDRILPIRLDIPRQLVFAYTSSISLVRSRHSENHRPARFTSTLFEVQFVRVRGADDACKPAASKCRSVPNDSNAQIEQATAQISGVIKWMDIGELYLRSYLTRTASGRKTVLVGEPDGSVVL